MVYKLDSQSVRMSMINSLALDILVDIRNVQFLLHSFQLSWDCRSHILNKNDIKLNITSEIKHRGTLCIIFFTHFSKQKIHEKKLFRIETMENDLTFAHIGFIPILSVWPIILRLTFVTVDSLSIMLTILTNTTSFIFAMNVQ